MKELGLTCLIFIPLGMILYLIFDEPLMNWRYWLVITIISGIWAFRSDIKELFR